MVAIQDMKAAPTAFLRAEVAVIDSIDFGLSGVPASDAAAAAALEMSEAAVEVIHGFLNQLIDAPAAGTASTAEALRANIVSEENNGLATKLSEIAYVCF